MNTTKLYEDSYIDFTKEPMFFGAGKNTQRFDVLKYPFFDERNNTMQGKDWTFDEVNMSSDRVDFHTVMRTHEKFMYTRVLQKLIFLDSLNGRGIILTLGQIVTLPELESCMTTWEYFETAKHSKTYTHNLRNVYDNPSEIFDESFSIPELKKLVKTIATPFEEAYELIVEFQYKCIKNLEVTPEFMRKLKKGVLLLLVNINILEGVRFYSGFSVIWAMNKGQNLVEGTSKNLSLIARDENIHLSITQKILQILSKDASEGFVEIYAECRDIIWQMYEECFKEECEWIDLLFSQGSLIGYNSDIAKDYLRYLTNRRLKAIGFNIMFQGYSKNPIPWIQDYINPDKVEVLPQEGEIINYISGAVDDNQDLDLTELKELYD